MQMGVFLESEIVPGDMESSPVSPGWEAGRKGESHG